MSMWCGVMDVVGFKGLLRLGVAAAALSAIPAMAEPVIKNGDFEVTTATASTEFGARYGGQVVTDWTTSGYNFIYLPGAADTTGAANEYGQQLQLWGPGNGSANGLPASSPAITAASVAAGKPSGGNFIAADGAFGQASIQQTVTGLSPNSVANITFWYAGAQQYKYDGATTEAWQVTLGNQTLTTPVLSNAEHGFTGWQKVTLSFIVTSATEVLSFLALGTPSGVPPFTLLDGVTISQVPEPTSLVLLGAGLAAAGLAARRRKAGPAA